MDGQVKHTSKEALEQQLQAFSTVLNTINSTGFTPEQFAAVKVTLSVLQGFVDKLSKQVKAITNEQQL